MNPPKRRSAIRKINGKDYRSGGQGASVPPAPVAPKPPGLEMQVRALSDHNAELKARNQKLEHELAAALARAAAAAAGPPAVDPMFEEIKRDLEKRNQELDRRLTEELEAHKVTREKLERTQRALEQLKAKQSERNGVPIMAPGREL